MRWNWAPSAPDQRKHNSKDDNGELSVACMSLFFLVFFDLFYIAHSNLELLQTTICRPRLDATRETYQEKLILGFV
jgi:hypothetical protein